jgi:hypothetical protein
VFAGFAGLASWSGSGLSGVALRFSSLSLALECAKLSIPEIGFFVHRSV